MRQIQVLKRAEWHASPEAPRPDVSFVPPLERRRLTALERAALAVAHAVWPDGAEIPVVFASRWGEIGVTAKLMAQMRADGEMSPAGFSASVHNAVPGVFSLFTGNHASYTAIAARSRTREMGWLEATAHLGRVLLITAEEETPGLYRNAIMPPQDVCAEAMLLEVTEA